MLLKDLLNVYLDKVDVYSLVDGFEVLNTYNLSEILQNISVDLLDGDKVFIYNNLKVERKLFQFQVMELCNYNKLERKF